jgi:hypothetical protein
VRVGSAAAVSAGRCLLQERLVFSQLGASGGEEGVGEHAGADVPVPGVHLRTWYWSRPSRSLPWALFSSIFQRIPATAISSGIGVGSGAWARKNSISLGSLTERRDQQGMAVSVGGGLVIVGDVVAHT